MNDSASAPWRFILFVSLAADASFSLYSPLRTRANSINKTIATGINVIKSMKAAVIKELKTVSTRPHPGRMPNGKKRT